MTRQRKKWSATRARQMETMGYTVDEVELNADGTLTTLARWPFFDGMQRMGLIMNDDEELLWRRGATIWAEDSVNRKGKVRRRSVYQRRTEIGDFDSGYRNFGVLGSIERAGGVTIPDGWSGSSQDLADFSGLSLESIADLTQMSTDELDNRVWNVTA
ncbi:hypothetical protein [Curtobacterium herbarum]|uniref:Uncharacterized protein n=1 Tax=Curtobacterium herbarum TaxID=150122 RepID=A0ABP4K8I0_9MICO|nr:hypothetical protein [Curtobacterium herbarum]MBM7474914.1 hypothetical protein [Curtobacterium herbarum]MCS6545559.1 hypothetical protein [Curtobacterium herbarum]